MWSADRRSIQPRKGYVSVPCDLIKLITCTHTHSHTHPHTQTADIIAKIKKVEEERAKDFEDET